jgi:hypothetical protein
MGNKFRVLRVVATIIKILAWIVLVLGVLGGCASLVLGLMGGAGGTPRGGGAELAILGGLFGAFSGVVVIIFAALQFLFLYAWGELIYLLLALEENTRFTAERLQATPKPNT